MLEKGLITAEQLKIALDEQVMTKEFLGKILLRHGQIREEDLLAALSEQFKIPVIPLHDKYIDWNLVKSFSASLILDYRCFPVSRDENSVTVAITNPLNAWVIHKIEEEARGFPLKLVLVSQGDIDEAIHRYQQYLRQDITKWF